MTRKYIIVADDSLKEFDEGIAKLEREWGAEEIEPCEDCISRQALLAEIDAERKHLLTLKMDGAEHIVVHHARRIIEDMPPVTPQPKIGHWIADVDRWGDIVTTVNGYRCSECDTFDTDKDTYCPNCGVKMEVEK